MKKAMTCLSALIITAAFSFAGGPRVDPGLPHYQKVENVRGTLNAAGSDTMLELQTLMAEAFGKIYPQVRIQVEGKGSSTAPPALIEGTVQLGDMSRKMKSSEKDAFEEKFGYSATRFDVALDTLAVFVNKDNPIDSLNLEQVDAIFSKTRRCGAPADIRVWGALGLGGAFRTAPISLYGRNAASGTYGYFKKHAMCKGDYKDSVKEQPGSASVVQGIEKDLYGIGYSGIGYKTSGVKAIALAEAPGEAPVPANSKTAADGSYPLARFLHIYVNRAPGKALDTLTAEYLRFVLSAEGQAIIIKAGFDPLDPETAAKQLKKLED